MPASLLIYGATGFVGDHITRVAAKTGMKPIVAGRDAVKLAKLAAELGVESRAFALQDRAAVERGLDGVSVLLNCAGPFTNTAGPLVEACLARRAHYLDITGEIPVYEALQARDAEAAARGSMLLPGVGFDVAPTDCLALYLKNRLPTATRLTLAFQVDGPAGAPPGTQKTVIEMLPMGERVRSGGKLVPPVEVPAHRNVDFGRGPVHAQLVPWGDVFTAYFSTGIPDIADYLAAGPAMERQAAMGRALAPLFRFAFVRALAKMLVRPGPTEQARASTRTHVWGEVTDDSGGKATARLHGPEAGVTWTTMTALAATRRAMAGDAPPGYQTPAKAYGADFVMEEGVTREDVG